MGYVIRPAREDEFPAAVAIDDSAASLYAEWGLSVDLPPEHPFCQAERATWLSAIRSERLFFAADEPAPQVPLGFAACGFADGAAYLAQLSVHASAMRRGVGRQLLEHVVEWATLVPTAEPCLWLTTYDHLPFNRAFYERARFEVVPASACGPDIRHHLDQERQSLPDPSHRVAMCRWLKRPGGSQP